MTMEEQTWAEIHARCAEWWARAPIVRNATPEPQPAAPPPEPRIRTVVKRVFIQPKDSVILMTAASLIEDHRPPPTHNQLKVGTIWYLRWLAPQLEKKERAG
jgi:hypothetical protein